MAKKKEIRMMVASADVAALVDQGAEVDTKLKNLTFEDKGIKTKLSEELKGNFEVGETSIKVFGESHYVVLTACESASIDVSSESFPAVRKGIDSGVLDGVVDRKLSLVVPPADVQRAADALKAAGIMATVAESLSVKAEVLRAQEASSTEQAQAMNELKKCVRTETTYRVKYEKKD